MNRCHAVCIGINYDRSPAKLNGCLNDARDWADALAQRGYVTTPLLEGEATRADILDQLTAAVAATGYRDRLVVTYSGHGTLVPDRSGDEATGHDQAWVPVDYATAGVILDDEIAAILARRRFGARITVISDSCYSGSMTRWAAGGATPRFLPPHLLPADVVQRARSLAALAPPVRPRTGAVLLSASSDQEVAWDAWIEGAYNGALSWAALRTLADRPATHAAWHAAIRRLLPSDTYPQTPQLDGTWVQRHLQGP